MAHSGPWPTVVIRTRAQNVDRTDVLGPLSLLTNRRGRAVVNFDGTGLRELPEGCVALSPAGARFSLHYGPAEAHPLNVHFGPALVRGLGSPIDDDLLPSPPDGRVRFPQIRHQPAALRRALGALERTDALAASRLHFDEAVLAVLELVLHNFTPPPPQTAEFSRLRAPTRSELIRRLNRGIDLMHVQVDRPLPLEQLAKFAALSPFHFARMFRAYTGDTPARYLARVRLDRAAALLETDRSLSDIALAVGYGDASALSRAFRRRFGVPPSRARRRARHPADAGMPGA